MKANKIVLFLAIAIATIYQTHAERVLHIRNQSPFALQFTVPAHNVDSRKALELAPKAKTTLAPAGLDRDLIHLVVPDDVKLFWINLEPQPKCHEGRCHESLIVSLFCIEDSEAIYDVYVKTDTYDTNWLTAFCSKGTINEELAKNFKSVIRCIAEDTDEDKPSHLCFPVGSKRADAPSVHAAAEVYGFTEQVAKRYYSK